MPHSVQALTDSDSHRRRLRLTGQLSEFLDKLVCLGVLDVEAHARLPFYPPGATRVPSDVAPTGLVLPGLPAVGVLAIGRATPKARTHRRQPGQHASMAR